MLTQPTGLGQNKLILLNYVLTGVHSCVRMSPVCRDCTLNFLCSQQESGDTVWTDTEGAV